jgi:P-type conjugative transfer protein TrbG
MTRFVTIAVVLALTSTAAGAQNAAPLTPQQKQDLSGYNFKAAESALQSQSNQPATKQQSLTPIPALSVPKISVPPIVSSIPAGQASQSTASTEKGSAVPLNWKLPHADLNAVGLSAAEVSRLWEAGASIPTQGENGKVVYIYGQGMPVLVCAPLRVCAIELQSGEHLQSQPQIGDSRRWEITPVLSGSGLDETPILIVKPIEAGLETDLIVPTDKRTYVVRLVSDPTLFVSRLAFQYPDEDRAKWVAFAARQDEARRNAEAIAEERREKDRKDGVVPMANNTVDRLYLDYKLSGDEHLRPDHVFDDGQHTYLIYPNDGRFRELPTLLLVVNGKTELVNFRVDGTRYIVDRLFDKAILVVGVGKKQTRVTITRETPYTQAGKEN